MSGDRRQRQAMVFGNMGNDCATGVSFTRNPSTGKQNSTEYLTNAKGRRGRGCTPPRSRNWKEMPRVFRAAPITSRLERLPHIRILVLQQDKLYMPDRTGKRTTQAAIKIAVDMSRKNVSKESDHAHRTAATGPAAASVIDPKS